MRVRESVCFLYTAFVLTVEACEAEHANLLCDVVPGARCPLSLELSFQLSPHQQNPVGHGLHIVLPRDKEIEKDDSTLCLCLLYLVQCFKCSFLYAYFVLTIQ